MKKKRKEERVIIIGCTSDINTVSSVPDHLSAVLATMYSTGGCSL